MEVILSVIGGSCGAAIVSGAVALLQFLINRKDQSSGKADVRGKALRYLMLYIIQERAKQHIHEGDISLDERRSLHHWHELYHQGLGGNGDADALMQQVERLPVRIED